MRLSALALALAPAVEAFDHSQCERSYTLEIRDWVVDYLRPTIDLGGDVVREKPFKLSDSVKKSALLVNNSYPGPLIEGTEGELLCVTVVNQMLEAATSIHWHGLHLEGFPSMDGVYGVTQAGIPAQGGSFTYRFRPNVGSHFYHAHLQAQQVDRGIKGPIVIRPRQDPYRQMYDEERVVVLSDERHNPEECMRAEGAEPGNPVCNEIDKASWNGQWGDGSSKYPWPLTTVEQGKCYRFRFMGMMTQAQNFQVSVAGHNMTLIAVDGVDVEPRLVSRFNVHGGERIDAVICADQEPGNYLMTAQYDKACFLEAAPSRNQPKIDSCNFWSFLHYDGHSGKVGTASKRRILGGYKPPHGSGGGLQPSEVSGEAWDTNIPAHWSQVRNREVRPEPAEPDVRFTINVGLTGPEFQEGSTPYGMSDRMFMFPEIKPWKKPATPFLQTKGECGADETPVLTVENGTYVEVVINNLSPTDHVLHMHGGLFSVVNIANYSETWCNDWKCFLYPIALARRTFCPRAVEGDPAMGLNLFWGCPYDETTDRQTQNLETPLLKDTITLPMRSWAVLRIRATNPGVWLFHCHMEQHIPGGQMMAFNIKPSEQPPIPSDVPTEGPCPVWSSRSELLV